MKNILSLFGILSIGASSVAPIMGNSITKNGNNNLGVKKIGITGEMTKLEKQCEEAKISKYMKYSDYDTQLEKRVMYIDQ
jgi:hypothetical protein